MFFALLLLNKMLGEQMTDLVVFKEADKEFYLYRVAMAVTSGNGLRRKLEGMQ